MKLRFLQTTCLACCLAISSAIASEPSHMEKDNVLKLSCNETAFVTNTIRILNVRLADRGIQPFEKSKRSEADANVLELKIDAALGRESFEIRLVSQSHLVLAGGSEKGLLYGVGKMLRTADYSDGNFRFGKWQGRSSPQKGFRAVYFATHIYNFYHISPIETIRKYVEDLALLGYNGLGLFLDKHHYKSPDDKEYNDFAKCLHDIYKRGTEVGMTPIVLDLTNVGFSKTPEHLKATYPGRSFYGCEVCPSTKEGMDLILANHRSGLEKFKDLGKIYYSLWSYDQGGCACKSCFPWGANGMYRCGKRVAEMVRSIVPEAKIIYCTWCFDYKEGEHEWEGLYKNLKEEKEPWFEYLLADSHETFPGFPLEHEKPKGVTIINFPEISMWGQFPWGGFGANPLPKRFSKLWERARSICDGGYLYSEGIFEDFNKALYAGFYWSGNSETGEVSNEYLNYELGSCESARFDELLSILEGNHKIRWYYIPGGNKNRGRNLEPLTNKPGVFRNKYVLTKTEESIKLVEALDAGMSGWAKRAWRWRILYIRAYLDHYLNTNGGEPGREAEKLLEELAAIYGVDKIGPDNPYLYMDRVNPFTDKFLGDQKKRLSSPHVDKQILKNF